MPSGEPPAADSDAETQQYDPHSSPSDMDEETLAMDDDLYAETQVVDEWADTQIVDDDLDGSATDHTEVLSSDDDDCGGGDDDSVGGGCVRVLDEGSAGGVGEANEATPEVESKSGACDGDGRSSGSARRSFSSVRTASLRASGLAAICRRTSGVSLSEQSSIHIQSKVNDDQVFDENESPCINYAKNQVAITGAVNNTTLPHQETPGECGNDAIVNLDDLKYGGRDFTSHRISNGVARSLFQEDNQLAGSNVDHDICQATVPVAGLSYAHSQEPSELSQANAVEVVDKFLLFNDLGLSEDGCFGMKIEVAPPPSTSAKGVQCLAKVAQKSPATKKAVYDWNDAFEDEGGGDFFVKRKKSIFHDDKNMKRSHNLHPKFRCHSERETQSSIHNRNIEADATPKIFAKTKRVCSDSFSQDHVLMGSSKRSESPRKTGMKTIIHKKTIDEFADCNLAEENIVLTADAFCDVGPDTQAAAEAMEALGFAVADELNPDQTKLDGSIYLEHPKHLTDLNEDHLNSACRKKKPLSIFYLDVVPRKLKRSRISSAKISSAIQSTDDKDMEEPVIRRKSARETLKKEVNAKPALEEIMVSQDDMDDEKHPEKNVLSFGNMKTINVDRKCSNSEKRKNMGQDNLKTSIQLPIRKKQKNMCLTPLSHMNRRSISRKLEKLNTYADDDQNGKLSGFKMVARERTRKVNNTSALVATLGSRETRSTESRQRNTLVDKNNNDVHWKADPLITDAPLHPKRRRTCLTREVSSVSNKPLCHNQAKTVGCTPIWGKESNAHANRSVDRLFLNADGILQNRSSISFKPGVRTRSSSYCERSKSFSPQSKFQCKFKGSPTLNGLPVASGSMPTELPSHNTDNAPHVGRFESSKSVASPKEPNGQSETICNSAAKVVEGSPVCASVVPSNGRYGETFKPSVARELIRLVSSEVTRTPVLKDSQRREMSSISILFSRHLEEKITKHLGKIAKRLGISIASSISEATHFITDKFVRTRNLLEAMAVGKPVVTPMWLKKCGEVSSFVDEKNYILKDSKKEKEIGFSMAFSLACSAQNPLLQGKRIFLTSNVKPDRQTVSGLIKAAGGQPLERLGRSTMSDDKVLDDLLIISCEEDYATCIPLLEKGVEIFSSELILNGIVIHKLEYERHRLFLDYVKQTRSTIWLKSEDSNHFRQVAKWK